MLIEQEEQAALGDRVFKPDGSAFQAAADDAGHAVVCVVSRRVNMPHAADGAAQDSGTAVRLQGGGQATDEAGRSQVAPAAAGRRDRRSPY